VLLQTAGDPHVWFLPGGRVEMFETAEQALRREIEEELHVSPEVGRLLWIVENFFVLEGRRYHEVGLYFALELPENCPKTGEFPAFDELFPLWMRWTPLDQLEHVRPGFLRHALPAPPLRTEHVVFHDALETSRG
jgi:ADP-ribose pyrophosphatase YjhB (NUDIX family)